MSEFTIHRGFPCNPANYRKGRGSAIQYLVIHYVGALGNAEQNAKYYYSSTVEASAHYFVGHAAEGCPVYASVPEGDTAWHCGRADGRYKHPGCRNANSIGIELCCRQDGAGKWYFDPETVDRAAGLARDIMGRYNIPVDRVVRHYDVTGKRCPAPYVDDPEAWAAFKQGLEGSGIMGSEAQAFEAFYEGKNPLYSSLEQVPEYWREEARVLIEAGALQGDGVHPIAIRREGLQALIAAMRYANNRSNRT